jgi:hypothetical protein
MTLGFEEEVVKYFNKFQGRNGKLLGDEILKVYKRLKMQIYL